MTPVIVTHQAWQHARPLPGELGERAIADEVAIQAVGGVAEECADAPADYPAVRDDHDLLALVEPEGFGERAMDAFAEAVARLAVRPLEVRTAVVLAVAGVQVRVAGHRFLPGQFLDIAEMDLHQAGMRYACVASDRAD